ncbi:MAG: methyl-accepting chemotaxis protein [Desulfobulbaceae bacterium]|nr:methyl-accepting chemotaxis protein [Desulfobulbaceae bacterium]
MLRIRSIRNKLMVGGLLVVLIPMVITMFLVNKKSSGVLTDMSKEYAQTMAIKLAEGVTLALKGAQHSVEVLINDTQLIKIATDVNKEGKKSTEAEIKILQEKIEKVSRAFKQTYPDIFVADEQGQLYASMFGNKTKLAGINVSDRRYFKQARETGKVILSDPIRSKADGSLVMVACGPIVSDSGKFLGVLGVTVRAEAITSLVTKEKNGKTGYAFMANSKGVIIAHPKKDLELKLDLNTLKGMEEINKAMRAGETNVLEYFYTGQDKVAGFAPVSMTGWSVAYTKSADEFLEAAVEIRNQTLILLVFSLVFVAIVILFASRNIVNPINRAVEGLTDIAEGDGDLTMRLEVNSGDEIGVLAERFNSFVEKLHGLVSDINSNLTALRESAAHFSSVSENMSSSSDEASDRSNTVAAAAEQMSANMNAVAAASEEAATNVNMVATSTEEMSSTVDEISENTTKAREVTDQAVSKTSSASQRMNELGGAAKEISKVTETITEISEQTNLLALNATIEAARAGEAGKGFAVVANEIKALAKQTAEATLEIRERIDAIQSSTNLTVAEMAEINTTINDVNEIVTTIAAAVDEQSSSTSDIASNVSQAAQGIVEVNENVSQISSVSGEISKEIIEVSQVAGSLRDNSGNMNSQSRELLVHVEKLQAVVNLFKL